MEQRPTNTTAIVTGGGRGIGAAFARAFARAGAVVDALVARAEEIHERGWYALRMIRGLAGLDLV